MLRRKDSNKVSSLFIWGIAGLVVGIGLIMFGMLSSLVLGSTGMALAGLGILLALGGSGTALGTVIYGLKQERGDQRETRVVNLDGVQITARFAINHLGETIFESDYIEFDHPKTKLYVRLNVPGQPQVELRTNQAVWMGCGEGMRGIAHVQGDWLGKFEHVVGPPPSGNPYLR